jgi:hypothetical protein
MTQRSFPGAGGDKSHFYQIEGDDDEQESLLGSDSSVQSNGHTKGKHIFEDELKYVGSPKLPGQSAVQAAEAFETAGLEEYFRPISSYEGIHRYDPEYRWTEREEKQVVRKVGP